MTNDHDDDQDGDREEPQQGEADQGQQSPADPVPCLTDGDARAEHRPSDDDGEHAAQQDRRQQVVIVLAMLEADEPSAAAVDASSPRSDPEFAHRGQRPDLQDQRR